MQAQVIKYVVIKYVLGFAFSPDNSKVLLIRKERPKWQSGLLNGVGGKVEGEEWLREAMVREFKEETDIDTSTTDWSMFLSHEAPDYELRCFSTKLTFAQCKQLEQTTDEKPGWYEVKHLGRLLVEGVPGVPMYVAAALNHSGRPLYTTTVEL